MVHPQERSPREALTLIEVVIAVGIMSLVLLGVFTAMAGAQRADLLTRERAAASEECFNQLDAMLAEQVPAFGEAPRSRQFAVQFDTGRGPVDLRPARPFPTDLWAFIGETPPATITEPGIAVARIGLEDPTDPNDSEMMEVRVMVAWRAADDTNQRIELVSRRKR